MEEWRKVDAAVNPRESKNVLDLGHDYAAELHLFFDHFTPDYEALREELKEAFSVI